MRLLVVDDDVAVAELLERVLTGADYNVEVLHVGAAVVPRVREGGVDLLLLDLELPDVDGLDVCRWVRAIAPAIPIVMLTGRGGEIDVVAGLSAGADDYVAKPFRPAELIARVRAHLRAAAATQPTVGREHDADGEPHSEPRGGHGVRVDGLAGRAWSGDRELTLTRTELEVLAVLVDEPGRVVSREQILVHLRDHGLSASPHSLDMHISAVRRAIATATAEEPDRDGAGSIATVRGVGYRFEYR